jgi:hypothetical protein
LPLSIRGQFNASYGHQGADLTGTLFTVTIDPDNGLASGEGFLLNDEFGRRYARALHLQAMKGNSVDLADIEYRIDGDPWFDDDYTIIFTKANLAATTGVMTPAFGDAYGEVDPLEDDELMASLVGDDPMVPLVAEFGEFTASIVLPDKMLVAISAAEEIMASGKAVDHAVFYTPEAAQPQKIVVTEDGRVYGHLGLWETCHDGVEGQCLMIPRPTDAYASFNKPGVLTNRGIVETGPIFAFGGHRKIGGKKPEDAYGGIENTWCDVRATEGVFGPWVSGIVRPGVADETVYAVRASRISGHWVGGKLKAIVSVNAEGFDVPGSGEQDGLALDLVAGFAAHVNDEGVTELVASFPGCAQSEQTETVEISLSDAERQRIVDEVVAALGDRVPDDGEIEVAITLSVDQQHADDLALAALIEADDD